jgi:hypothetical protein
VFDARIHVEQHDLIAPQEDVRDELFEQHTLRADAARATSFDGAELEQANAALRQRETVRQIVNARVEFEVTPRVPG